jgi:uncharacterized protein (TIGR00255 family)
MKAVNHRFLDLKLRLPREFQSWEIQARKFLETRLGRGALDIKVERLPEAGVLPQAPQINLALAAHYFESLRTLQKTLGLNDSIRTAELAQMPEVFSRAETSSAPSDQAWGDLEALLNSACAELLKMRATEGAALTRGLLEAATELSTTLSGIRARRDEWISQIQKRQAERIRSIFEANPLPSTAPLQAVLESRIAQELALLLDRSDVEEELTRFQGHLDHLRQIFEQGGAVGRKLEFVLQELGREVNTLSNKAQDLGISTEAVGIKVKLEQLREQSMNLE